MLTEAQVVALEKAKTEKETSGPSGALQNSNTNPDTLVSSAVAELSHGFVHRAPRYRLLITLGHALMAAQGLAAPEPGEAFSRALVSYASI